MCCKPWPDPLGVDRRKVSRHDFPFRSSRSLSRSPVARVEGWIIEIIATIWTDVGGLVVKATTGCRVSSICLFPLERI